MSAPSVRAAAVSQAIKGVGAQFRSTGHPTPTKMPRIPVAKGQAGKGQMPKPARAQPNPLQRMLNINPVQKANQIAKGTLRGELQPIHAEEGRLNNTEQTISNRYGQYAQQNNAGLEGLQGQAAANAKTYANTLAETALKTTGNIESTGQSAAAQNGGYLDPQVKAALNSQGTLAAGVGSAQSQLQQNLGQGEQNFLTNLRASAAMRAVQGEQNLTSAFRGPREKLATAAQGAIAKEPVEAQKLALSLGQQQAADTAVVQKLRSEGIKLGLTARNDQERNQIGRANSQNARERNRLTERGQNITQKHYEESDATARLRARDAATKQASSAQGIKVAEHLGSAFETIRQLRELKIDPSQIRNAIATGVFKAEDSKTGKEVKLKFSKVAEPVLVQAAFELWNYHKVSAATAARLSAMGLSGHPREVVGL